ncbi:MAG: DUF4153 domain-containing protein [Bacteroidetes bacterium]|jgi:hypothetical protein|nr:DUF4153 domain-containing protein [Bacteroidota bacterium]
MLNASALKSIKDKAIVTVRRFPLPILIASVAACCLIWLIDSKERDPYFYNVIHFVLTLSLALPAFTGLCFFNERSKHPLYLQLLGQVILVILGAWYHYSIPVSFGERDAARHAILILSMHLWVAFAPFVRYREIQGFWQYNKHLFIRFLTATLYSGVLFGGLALAIFAVDQLFDVRIDEDNYARLWVLIATVFNTWFFLSDLPEDLDALDQSLDYPNGLRLFTQFVLLPLVTIYLSILYVYMFKIILSSNWPKGWVSYLVIGFSTAGILALLLVWPLQSNDRFKWIKAYVKYFFMALFPLILMLAFAIYIRVKDYGITENRYFIMVLALWLFVNAIYFLLSTVKNIKVIPMSLFFVALLSGFGSWNAFTVSKNSQSNRLLAFADQYGMLKDQKMVPLSKGMFIPDSVLVEISSITYYLISTHGIESMKPLLAQNIDSLSIESGRYDLARKIMAKLNLEYTNGFESKIDQLKRFNYACQDNTDPIDVKGYSFYKSFDFYYEGDKFSPELKIDSTRWLVLSFNVDKQILSCKLNDGAELKYDMNTLAEKLFANYSNSNYSIPQQDLTIFFESEEYKCKILFKSIEGEFLIERKIDKLNHVRMDILYFGK